MCARLRAQEENKDDEEEGSTTKSGLKRINLGKIADTIIGLKTYEGVKRDEMEKKMLAYHAWTDSSNDPGISIWTFLMALFLMILNLYGKSIKNSYLEEYGIRKVVESYFYMNLLEEELDNTL